MTVADNIKTYPAGASYEVWNRAKSKSVGDKVSTGLGEALSQAWAAYAMLHWEQLDVKRWQLIHGPFKNSGQAEVARQPAQLHFRTALQPAIRALEKAKTKATAAGKNVVISKARNDAAKAISKALDEPIRVLKAIHIDDFDAECERWKKKA